MLKRAQQTSPRQTALAATRLVNAAPNIDLIGLKLTPATVVEGEEGNGMWPFYLKSR